MIRGAARRKDDNIFDAPVVAVCANREGALVVLETFYIELFIL